MPSRHPCARQPGCGPAPVSRCPTYPAVAWRGVSGRSSDLPALGRKMQRVRSHEVFYPSDQPKMASAGPVGLVSALPYWSSSAGRKFLYIVTPTSRSAASVGAAGAVPALSAGTAAAGAGGATPPCGRVGPSGTSSGPRAPRHRRRSTSRRRRRTRRRRAAPARIATGYAALRAARSVSGSRGGGHGGLPGAARDAMG